MTHRTTPAGPTALRPVEPAPGVLVHSSADRRLAAEHWLLSTLRDPQKGRDQWQAAGVAMLPLGTLFCAVRLPARLVLAVTGAQRLPAAAIDAVLNDALGGAPVICDPRHRRYYVLLPASVHRSWNDAADDWRLMGIDVLGRGSMLGVPDLERTQPRTLDSYWSVPMESAAVLGAPLTVARFIAAAQHLLGDDQP
ncbi:hypothetical protein [Streptomyces sp. T028]|uniref:hypothetical protein n=1 Tax=Streptomyces sp. T028 TaxID=3394379 RepID=UPI003A8A24A0